MQVILLERIENLGQMGDVVRVKAGFARNFLLPKKKALRATDENLKVFESRRTQLEADNLKRRDEATQVGGKLDGLKIVVVRQAAETGQLYGSVTLRDIADDITRAGFTVQRSQIMLGAPIKTTGVYEVGVALHPEVKVKVTINVARSTEEAETQAAGGNQAIADAEKYFDKPPAPATEAETAEAQAKPESKPAKEPKAKKARAKDDTESKPDKAAEAKGGKKKKAAAESEDE
jgi:large subunit ribosomal protein L9